VGGQNGIGADGEVVGDSVGAQTEQAMRNLIAVLAEAGATPADVAKLTIILVEGVDVNEGFAASRKVWGRSADGRHRTVRARLCPSGLPRRGRRDRGRPELKRPRTPKRRGR
jgi:enamine deaminase RidA (YjgF/YER057c/UK114 family)